MSQPLNKVPKPPKRQNEATETDSVQTDSVRTVNVRAPSSITGESQQNVTREKPKEEDKEIKKDDAKKEDEKKKPAFANWKEKMAAGAATLNAAMVAGGEKMRNRLADNSSDDEDDVESSDEEMEDLFSTTDSAISNTPSATAIAIRNQPAVNFINLEEEERIKGELKDAKNLRKKLRKIKKVMKKSAKSLSTFSEVNEKTLASMHAATDDKCTDPTINELAVAAETRIQEVKQSNALANFNTNITDQILEQIKPINDHAKMISVTGKERRAARDRRIRMALGEVDVTNEEEYNKSVDLVRDFEEKDRTYKDEFVNFREHNSSQLGQMLRCYLLETATYLETLAKALRESAGGTANNYYLSNDCCTKFKDFKVDAKFLSPIPPLFSHLNPNRENDDRLTAKPQPPPQSGLQPHPPGGKAAAPALAGIPMSATEDGAEEKNAYGSSTYTRSKDNTRVRRGIDNFLLTGQLPASDTSRLSPQPFPGRSPNIESPQETLNGPLPGSDTGRARPTSVFDTSSTTKSLMDYIHSLADEYGIEPDFSVRRGADMAAAEAKQTDSNTSDNVNEDEDPNASRPPSVVPRPKSATPDGSLILPSLRGSGRISAPPRARPAVASNEL